MSNFQGYLFCLLGKSCSGKDTLYKALLGQSALALKPYVTYTTRPMRVGEVDGVDYHFVTVEGLRRFEDEGRLIEERVYQTIHGPWHYATIADGQLEQGTYSYLGIVTLDAFVKLRQRYGTHRVIPLFVQVADEVLLKRALEREAKETSPNYREVCRRFLADSEDFSEAALEDAGVTRAYFFVNEVVDQCVSDMGHAIESVIATKVEETRH